MATESRFLPSPLARDEQPAWRNFWHAAQRMLRNRLTLFGLAVMLLVIFTALFAPVLMPDSPTALRLGQRLRPPSAQFLLGTDEFGRDILSRIIGGTQVSLQIGLIVIGLAGTTGYLLGSASGYLRGRFDGVVMRVMDVILAFPPLIL